MNRNSHTRERIMKTTVITITLGLLWLSILYSMVYTTAAALITTVA